MALPGHWPISLLNTYFPPTCLLIDALSLNTNKNKDKNKNNGIYAILK